MKKDKWITPDDYHFQDILDNGRCVYCGKQATGTTKSGHKFCSDECSDAIYYLMTQLHN